MTCEAIAESLNTGPTVLATSWHPPHQVFPYLFCVVFTFSVVVVIFIFSVVVFIFSAMLQLIKIDVFVRTTSSSYYLFRLEKDLDGYLIMVRDYTYHFMDTSSP